MSLAHQEGDMKMGWGATGGGGQPPSATWTFAVRYIHGEMGGFTGASK